MKKLLLTLVLAGMTMSMAAQDKVVRKARYLKEEVQNLVANNQRTPKEDAELQAKLAQCMAMVDAAVNSPETVKELANAWDIKASLHTYIFNPLLNNIIAHEPTDTAAFAANVFAALDAYEECYQAVQRLGLKGDKDPYTQPNKLNVVRFRPYIAYCGQMFFGNHDYAKAKEAFLRWLDYPSRYTILGADAQQLTVDEQTPQIAYYACLAAYFDNKDFKTMAHYIPQAKAYEEEKQQVNQLWLTSLIEQGDTTAWLAAGQQVVLEDPTANDALAQNILAYYFNHEDVPSATAFVDALLEADEDSRLGNYARGLVYMNNKEYLTAITYFDRAIAADPEFADAYYNAGVCYSNHGYDLNDALNGRNMTVKQREAEIAKVRAEYAKAEPYFLKVQELEPGEVMKWATRLRTVYYILDNKAKEAEMNAIVGD